MFAEIEVAEHLLKNKEKISKSASIDELNKLWVNFEEKSDDYVKAAKQMQECNKKHSLFVLRKTPAIHKYYTLKKVLGNPDQYGICKEAICIDKKSINYQKQFAVKIINKHKYNDPKFTYQLFSGLRAETQLLAAAHEHPNIITYHQVFEDLQHLYIVMNYCGGGELFDTISGDQKLSEQTIANLFRQMMSSLVKP